jgi:hypothetical protein
MRCLGRLLAQPNNRTSAARAKRKLIHFYYVQERARVREAEAMQTLSLEFGSANHFFPIKRTQVNVYGLTLWKA